MLFKGEKKALFFTPLNEKLYYNYISIRAGGHSKNDVVNYHFKAWEFEETRFTFPSQRLLTAEEGLPSRAQRTAHRTPVSECPADWCYPHLKQSPFVLGVLNMTTNLGITGKEVCHLQVRGKKASLGLFRTKY